MSEETVVGRSKGWTMSPEARAKISAANKGRKHSPEAIEKMRQSHLGKSNPTSGRKKGGTNSKPVQEAEVVQETEPEVESETEPEVEAEVDATAKRRKRASI